jgi:large subunit ribosomal protein L25
MIKEVQRDIFRHQPIHIDFHAISLTDRRQFHVPVALQGVPRGVADGGVVEHHLREVLVECLPTQIPEQLSLDVSDLVVGRSLHASDLIVPEGVTLRTAPDEVVVTVVAPRVHEEAAPAAVAEGAPPAEGAPAAPVPAAEGATGPAEKKKGDKE